MHVNEQKGMSSSDVIGKIKSIHCHYYGILEAFQLTQLWCMTSIALIRVFFLYESVDHLKMILKKYN